MHFPITAIVFIIMLLSNAAFAKSRGHDFRESDPAKTIPKSSSIQDVELISKTSSRPVPGLTADAPRPVFYRLPGSFAPSCGLVAVRGQEITPILEVGQGESYPQCAEVVDGALFSYRNHTAYVLKYRQRDTKEDTSTAYFFVQEFQHRLRPLDFLNRATPPRNLRTKDVAVWAKGRAAYNSTGGDWGLPCTLPWPRE